MVKINILGVVTEGYRLIRREPLAVLVWGGALFVLMGLPFCLLMSQMAPMVLSMSAVSDDASASMRGFQTMFAILPLVGLGMLAGYTVVGAAILRAVMTPEDRRHFYLRLSRAEMWLAISAVVGWILFYIASVVVGLVIGVVAAIPVAIVATVLRESSLTLGLVHALSVLAVVVIEVAAFYFAMRFSMAPIMSFDERRFRLFEAWAFTRGNGWRLTGVALLIVLAVLGVELLVAGGFVAAVGPGLFQDVPDPATVERLSAMMDGFMRAFASPFLLLISLVWFMIFAPLLVLSIAPYARAYQLIRDGSAAAA